MYSFLDFFFDIWKIEIFKNKANQTKEVLITLSSLKRASIFIDQHHQMIGYSNDFLDIVASVKLIAGADEADNVWLMEKVKQAYQQYYSRVQEYHKEVQ